MFTVSSIQNADPLDIPDALRVTLRGRQVDETDSNYNEQFLMYCNADRSSWRLESGRSARVRKAAHVKVDKDIASAMLQYGMSVGSILCFIKDIVYMAIQHRRRVSLSLLSIY